METRIGKVEECTAKEATVRVESGALRVGDHIHVLAAGEDVWATVTSLQLRHSSVERAGLGETVEAILDTQVPAGGEVYKLTALEAHEGDEDLKLSRPPVGPDDLQ